MENIAIDIVSENKHGHDNKYTFIVKAVHEPLIMMIMMMMMMMMMIITMKMIIMITMSMMSMMIVIMETILITIIYMIIKMISRIIIPIYSPVIITLGASAIGSHQWFISSFGMCRKMHKNIFGKILNSTLSLFVPSFSFFRHLTNILSQF